MSYTTLAELTGRYGAARLLQLTDRATPPAGAIDTDVVDQAIADTGALIDGYLAGRYKLPLSETPPLVADLAEAIAFYKLHVTAAAEKIAADYRDALATLKQIAAGTVRLNVAGLEPDASGTSGVETTDRTRDLTPENLKGFI